MFPSFLLALREGLEAALIIGIVLGALRKLKRPEITPDVWRGVFTAVIVSLIFAIGLNRVGAEFEGRAEEIYEGLAMLSAAVLLTWMIFWMRRQAPTLRQDLESDVRRAVRQQGSKAVFMLAFLAVGREGFELALFLLAAQASTSALLTIFGAILGLGLAAILGWLIFATSRQLSLRRFFLVSNILLILFAAGLVAHGIHEFNEAGIIPAVVEHVWDINPILNENSIAGQMLKALFGYNGNPSLTEAVGYGAYFLFLYSISLIGSRREASSEMLAT